MKWLGVLLIATVLVFAASVSLEASIINTRPVYVNPTGGDGPGTSLQDIFNDITVSGTPVDAVNDQTPFAVFQNDASGGAVATMIIQLSANNQSTAFGLYDLWNTANKAQIFAPGAASGTQALVSFMANGDIYVNFALAAQGFGGGFGFYIDLNNQQNTFYTQDSENVNGEAHALVYQGNGSTRIQVGDLNEGIFTPNELIMAWEDQPLDVSDNDYQDMVVLVESVSPYVPEPATIAIWSLLTLCGGLGLHFWRRSGVRRPGIVGSGREPWTTEAREAIHQIIERGRVR
jgi:hypothetical protein